MAQLLCKECGKYKPEKEVQLSICDDCFKYGAPRKTQQSAALQPAAPTVSVDADHIILTTSIDIPNRSIERVVSIVAARPRSE